MSTNALEGPAALKHCGECGGTYFRVFEVEGQLFLRCAACQNAPGSMRFGVMVWLPEAGCLPAIAPDEKLGRLFADELRLYLELAETQRRAS